MTVRIAGAAVVLELADLLDADTGAALVAAAEAATATGPTRVDIDLRSLQVVDPGRRRRARALPGDLR